MSGTLPEGYMIEHPTRGILVDVYEDEPFVWKAPSLAMMPSGSVRWTWRAGRCNVSLRSSAGRLKSGGGAPGRW